MSVCNLAADSTIASIVEAMLPRNSAEIKDSVYSKALLITVKLSLSYYGDGDDEDRESRVVHFIFCRPSNYTKVFASTEDVWSHPKVDGFTMTCDHDSGWRTDGLRPLSESYLDALHELRERLRGRRPEIHHSEFNTIHTIQYVHILWKDDPEDSRLRYRKILTQLHPAKP